MNIRSPLLLLVPIIGLASLIWWFGPPSGFIGERAALRAEAVFLLEFSGDCAGNQNTLLQLEFIDRNPVVLQQTYFDGGPCQLRFVLPPGQLTSFSLNLEAARSSPNFTVARIVDQTGAEIKQLPLSPGNPDGGKGPRFQSGRFEPVTVPPVSVVNNPNGQLFDAIYLIGLLVLLLAGMLTGLPSGTHP